MNLERIKLLNVITPQGASGVLHKEARYSFNYTSQLTETLASIAMPFRHESYSNGDLFGIFAMNRPEGFLLESLRERFGKLTSLDDMALLKITGENQIGRLSYLDPAETINNKLSSFSLDEILKAKASEELFQHLISEYFASGISGFQPKVMVPERSHDLVERSTTLTPDLIVKASGYDFPHLTANEYLCMSVAKEAGIRVPEFWLSEDNGLFVLKRFDLDTLGNRLGLEDMCVLTGKTTEAKYQGSYEGIAKIISQVSAKGVEDLKQYFSYIATSVLVKNGDAHLKNFSIVYSHPEAEIRLAPLYDVVCTQIYSLGSRNGMNVVDRTMALNMNKTKHYPTDKELIEFGKQYCQLTESEAAQIISQIETAKLNVHAENKHRFDRAFMRDIAEAWGISNTPLAI